MKDKISYKFLKSKTSPQGVVIFTHGYRAHGLIYRDLIRHFLKEGYHIVIWDMPGHGHSFGEKGCIEDIQDCVNGLLFVLSRTLRETKKLPIYLVAHSTGFPVSALALSCLHRKKRVRILSRIHGLIGVGPALNVLHNVSWSVRIFTPLAPLALFFNYFHKIKIGGWNPERITDDKEVAHRMKTHRSFYRGPLYMQTAYQIYRAGKQAQKALQKMKVPIYFIYGELDEVTYPIPKEKLPALKLNDASIKVYKGLKHDPIDGQGTEQVRQELINWIQEKEKTFAHA